MAIESAYSYLLLYGNSNVYSYTSHHFRDIRKSIKMSSFAFKMKVKVKKFKNWTCLIQLKMFEYI